MSEPRVDQLLEEANALKREALASGQMHQPITVDVNRQQTLARVSIPLIGDGTNAASVHALQTLRGSLVPKSDRKSVV